RPLDSRGARGRRRSRLSFRVERSEEALEDWRRRRGRSAPRRQFRDFLERRQLARHHARETSAMTTRARARRRQSPGSSWKQANRLTESDLSGSWTDMRLAIEPESDCVQSTLRHTTISLTLAPCYA